MRDGESRFEYFPPRFLRRWLWLTGSLQCKSSELRRRRCGGRGPLSFRAMHSEVCKCSNMLEALHFNKKKHKLSSFVLTQELLVPTGQYNFNWPLEMQMHMDINK